MSAAIDLFAMLAEPPPDAAMALPAAEAAAGEGAFRELLGRKLDDEALDALAAFHAAVASVAAEAEAAAPAALETPIPAGSPAPPPDTPQAAMRLVPSAPTALVPDAQMPPASVAQMRLASVAQQPLASEVRTPEPPIQTSPDAAALDPVRAEHTAPPMAEVLGAPSSTGLSEVVAYGRRAGETAPNLPAAPLADGPEANAERAVRAGTPDADTASTASTVLAASVAARAARSMPARSQADGDAAPTDARPAAAGRAGEAPAVLASAAPEPRDAPRPTHEADRAPELPNDAGRPVGASLTANPAAREAQLSLDVAAPEAQRATVAPAQGATATADTASLPRQAPTLAAPVEELPARIEWLAQRGGGAARIELDPPNLGRVDMIVRVRGGDVEVVIAASEPAAQAAVQAQRGQLAENLAARDLRLSQLDVSQSEGDAPHREPGSDGRTADTGAESRGRHAHDPSGGAEPVAHFEPNSARPNGLATSSRIDLHA